MKFTCDKTKLEKEIALAKKAAGRDSLNILSCISLAAEHDRLVIRATNLTVYFETFFEAAVEVPGTAIVNIGKLLDILKSLPQGTVIFEDDGSNTLIKPEFEKVTFKLKRLSDDTFPALPSPTREPVLLAADTVKDMIRRTIFAVSNDETRYFMNGAFIGIEREGGNMVMVATDGPRLSLMRPNLQGIDIPSAIVPTPVLEMALKIIGGDPVKLSITETNIFIEYGPYKLSSTLIEGQFPNYRKVIPKSQEYQCLINRDDLLKAVKRTSTLVEAKTRRIYLGIHHNELSIYTEDGDIGSAREEIACEYEGPELTVALNCCYLKEACEAIDGDVVLLELTEADEAITLRPPAGEYFHIIMPMRVE